MAMQINYITVEMADGTVHDKTRVTLQDRVRLERAARANDWEMGTARNSPSVNAFLAWAGLTRTGQYTGTYEDFTGTDAVDIYVETGEAVLGNPTVPAAGTD